MTTLCPECGTALVEAKGIGEICPYEDCPVIDDADLWDGNGYRADPPKIVIPTRLFPMQDGPDIPWERMAERGGIIWSEISHFHKAYKKKHRRPPDWKWT